MRIIVVVGEGLYIVRRHERVQFSSLAIALSARCFTPHPISPVYDEMSYLYNYQIQMMLMSTMMSQNHQV